MYSEQRAQTEAPCVERTTNKLELLKDLDQNDDDMRDHALATRTPEGVSQGLWKDRTENVEKTPGCVEGNEKRGCGGKVEDRDEGPELEIVDEMK